MVAPGAGWIEAVEGVRVERRAEGDAGGPMLAEREDALAVPGRHPVEGRLVGVLDARPLELGVEPGQVDELGPATVGGRRHGMGQLLLARA